jgi:hypothetical protein
METRPYDILRNMNVLQKNKTSSISTACFLPGDDLLSQDPAVQVPSALESLTSVFGMGTGVTSPS